MRKSTKVLTALMLSAACACGAAALSGCAQKQTVTGEMSYSQWGTTFGIKVSVEVQTDSKGDRIRKVTIADSDLVSASPEGWDSAKWYDHLDKLLLAYRGEYVADILAKEVLTSEAGAPLTTEDEGFSNYGEEFIATGATLGSGRLLIAVQNALKNFGGYKVVEGSYSYEQWGTTFGEKVRVVVKDDTVLKVAILSSDLCNASPSGWDSTNWFNNREAVLANYEGKKVEDILSGTAQVGGQDGAETNSVSDSNLIATNATLSSARLYKSVQNALSKL